MSGMVSRRVPLSFILQRHRLTWAEAARGYTERWLLAVDLVALAADRSARGGATADELAMATVSPSGTAELVDVLERLVAAEPPVERADLYRMWMRLLLAWAYENRAEYQDPLGIVEEIYTNFDYAKEIEHLVGYMPPAPTAASDTRDGESPTDRLMRRWREYVSKTWSVGDESADGE